ncbi:hypothetical protein SRHO_G00156350 [Serrasalmus rhombeus]
MPSSCCSPNIEGLANPEKIAQRNPDPHEKTRPKIRDSPVLKWNTGKSGQAPTAFRLSPLPSASQFSLLFEMKSFRDRNVPTSLHCRDWDLSGRKHRNSLGSMPTLWNHCRLWLGASRH